MYDLKAAQVNVQCSLILEMFHEFEPDHNATETTKNICVKGKSAIDHSIVAIYFKKFRLSSNNLDHQVSLKP